MKYPFINKEITYFGVLRAITSWAKVSRELISSLLAMGLDVNIYERKGFRYDAEFPLDYNIKTRITNKFKGDIVFTFEHPSNYKYLPDGGFNIGLLVYEFTNLPSLWVENINKYLDMVVLPSEFCRNTFIKCGVDKNKIRVLRYGFNPLYYYPKSGKDNGDKHFTFLCVANPHRREGVELLLKSFTNVFSKEDNVRLILKLSYMPEKNIKSFEYNNLPKTLNEYINKKGAPKIKIITDNLSEEEMGDLYRASDCYASLTRAEAFGLCFLEALACGLPVVSVKWGGQVDFLNGENAYFVKHTLVKAKGEEYEKTNDAGVIALPDVDHAADIIRKIYDNRGSTDKKQYTLYSSPSHFCWHTIAEEFCGLLNEV